ncbi:hypothetical protein ATANTOWER_019912 [Ataeniobius toweri]|uniref:Uncharacterized protein n=1 Tax=Ataeniobius toweri TaxID=208326 RepID=A0ABU7C3P5_9TELE|nr:hypothetical protein [Ataeniobius toweri]
MFCSAVSRAELRERRLPDCVCKGETDESQLAKAQRGGVEWAQLMLVRASKRSERVYVRFVRARGQRFGGQGEHGGGQRFFGGWEAVCADIQTRKVEALTGC